ncbi:Dbl homology domain-containing protein [Globomyces pollinis-pini]|nr:Dbl homology domain-containing protein [Globomyces pollinis-pini]
MSSFEILRRNTARHSPEPIKKSSKANGNILDWNPDKVYTGPFSKGSGKFQFEFEKLEAFEDNPSFEVPPFVRQTEIQGPLFSAQIDGIWMPSLIDSISGALTVDAWDWQSEEIETAPVSVNQTQQTSSLEATLSSSKRGYIVWELIKTEQNYVKQMSVLDDFFRKNLQEKEILSDVAINSIFYGIGDLNEFHKNFLKELEDSLSDWNNDETRIGSLFLMHVEELRKIYTKYIDNYTISQKWIKKEEQENQGYLQFTKDAEKLEITGRQSLKDSLMFPVQRTTRYHLLLKDLLKSTKDDHPDHRDLSNAWDAMASLATSVNDKKREEEEATGLFDAFQQTKHCPPVLISHRRRLILSSEVMCFKSNRPFKLFICSDLLMVALTVNKTVMPFSKTGPEFTHRFIRWIDLIETDILDLHSSTPNCLRIILNSSRTPKKHRSFTTPTAEIPSIAKEMGASSFVVQFTGYDANKSRSNFIQTIETVCKACIAKDSQ